MWAQEARPLSAGVREGGTERGGGRCRPRVASGPGRHRPPVDPPPRACGPPGAPGHRETSSEEKTPTPQIGWGCAGRGRWTASSWLTWNGGERAACPCPPGQRSCGAGWEGRVGRESGFSVLRRPGSPCQTRCKCRGSAPPARPPRLSRWGAHLASWCAGLPASPPPPPPPGEAALPSSPSGRVWAPAPPRAGPCKVTDGRR